jgi:hypothetical protein
VRAPSDAWSDAFMSATVVGPDMCIDLRPKPPHWTTSRILPGWSNDGAEVDCATTRVRRVIEGGSWGEACGQRLLTFG